MNKAIIATLIAIESVAAALIAIAKDYVFVGFLICVGHLLYSLALAMQLRKEGFYD